jgi:biopolymer transport protein ExbB
MDLQLGLISFWTQADGVTQSVALVLLGMSLASWLVLFIKALALVKTRALGQRTEKFWHNPDFASSLTELRLPQHNPFSALAQAGLDASAHHRNTQTRLKDSLDLSDWLSRALRHSIDDSNARCQSGLAVLASVGSTAPFVGLFGTVWGIYHALMGIGVSGQTSIDKIAGPIGEALIMTALGLAVAIPAVLGYNALVRGNKFILIKISRFAHDLHAYFLTGARVRSEGAVVVNVKNGH